MAEPNTPGEARKQGLRKSRWVAAGAAVGAAAFLTGIIAGVNGADDDVPTQQISVTDDSSQYVPRSDDGYSSSDRDDSDDDDDDDDDFDRPFTPQQPSGSSGTASGSTQQVPSFTPQPQTRSGGS